MLRQISRAAAGPGRFPIKWNPVGRRKRPIYRILRKYRAPERAILALALLAAGACTTLGARPNLAGDYLSGRVAASANAIHAAAAAYGDAHAALPQEATLLREAFFYKLAIGDVAQAAPDARALLSTDGGDDGGLARIALVAVAMKSGDLKGARSTLNGEMGAPFLKSIAFIVDAWIEDGLVGPDAALKKLDSASGDVFAGFNPLHKGLIAEGAGENALAKSSFEEALGGLGGPVGREAYGAFLERSGDKSAAREFYSSLADQPGAAGRLAEQGLDRLNSDKASKAYHATTPAEGAAIACYTFAAALIESAADQRQRAAEAGFSVGEPSYNLPLVLARLALYLDPGLNDARRLVGTILDIYGDHAGAADMLAGISPSSPLYEQARIEIAGSYAARGRNDQAIKTLKEAIKRDPKGREMQLTLADLYAGAGKRDDAVKILDKIIAGLPEKPNEDAWRYYVARGGTLLDLGRWPEAEKDLKRAVEIAPDEPAALNYLGYSWAERGENLEEAFKLIERAVAAAPQSGAIVDSLGWAHFQLGDYRKAVKNLEKAAALEPGDPTITDHLGDAYWRLGRKIEARYQWRRALELNPSDKLKIELDKKLAQGLPEAPKPTQK